MSDMTPELVLAYAAQLREYAEHFEQRDWDYTRNIAPLVAIRYDLPADRLLGRIRRSFGWLFGRRGDWMQGWAPHRVTMALHVLRRDRNLPDGVLDNGSIITHWEETGEYLQYVQPSVGSKLADFLEAEPDHPHALLIAAEMKRINDRYGERLASDANDE